LRRLAPALGIGVGICLHYTRTLLHENLNFHSYKMVMVETINDQDTVNRKTEVLLNALDDDDLTTFS